MHYLSKALSLFPYPANAAVTTGVAWGITKLAGDHYAAQTAQATVSDLVCQLNQTGAPLPDIFV